MPRVHSEETEKPPWINCVRKAIAANKLLGVTCQLYSKKQSDRKSPPSQPCLCGRLPQRHSFSGEPKTERIADGHWKDTHHTKPSTVTVYGIWNNKTNFVRWAPDQVDPSDDSKTNLSNMAEILANDTGNKKPILLVSCFGGAKYFKMSHKLEKDFMNGIGEIAATEGVWLLSTGLNSGVSKVIGLSVERRTLLSEKKANYTVIGLTSWGCLSNRTRQVLRQQARKLNLDSQRRDSIIEFGMLRNNQDVGDPYLTLDENDPNTFENNHTHFLMIDDGSEGSRKTEKEGVRPYYLTDQPRSDLVYDLMQSTKCLSVTIIIEGGLDSFDVIANDLKKKRPVVVIHGSGRCATVIGNLLELTRDQIKIEKDEIDRQLRKHIVPKSTEQQTFEKYYKVIDSILKPEKRFYLTVFKLDNNTSLTDTIFLAIYKAQMNDKPDDIKKLLDLAVTWNCGNGIDDVFENNQVISSDQKLNIELFEKALIKNRPVFVDYFLRKQYNILETSKYIGFKDLDENIRRQTTTKFNVPLSNEQDETIDELNKEDDAKVRAACARKFLVEDLYKKGIDHLEESYQVDSFDGLDRLYYQYIGPYAESFFHFQSTKDRTVKDLKTIIHFLSEYFHCCQKNSQNSPEDNEPPVIMKFINNYRTDQIPLELGRYVCLKKFGNEEMFRDLFLWSVISGYSEMSFIFLLQIRFRIIASLIAAGITSRLVSTKNGYLDQWHKFHKQSENYEKFARECIDACYERNQQKACQLLLKEIPLFGNVTCMQVAISFRLKSFINSRCFNQVLNRQWYGTLDQTTNEKLPSAIFFILSIISLGFLAPFSLKYRNDRMDDNDEEDSDSIWEGVHDQNSDQMDKIRQFTEFHRSPIVRMTYHFLFYIWMLLAFSYFMLFEIKSSDQPIHWTEKYVIATISAMLIEDLRRVVMEYLSRMLERWHLEDLWIISLYVLPYILFYIGIGLHFGSKQRPDLFASAKIVLALDLELWFLFSLRFVSAIKLLGPKLFMIRNMLRVLAGFVYIIFICIAAYGIVSRSLVTFDDLEFTAKNLSYSIFYRPYWFLYSIVDDEREDLNDITQNSLSTSDEVAEATTVQVLFVFQMLFINILILNLLIAVFNFTINAVQDESEYLWRYQRYELIREYFEKFHLAYPPLSLLGYLYVLVKLIFGYRNIFRIFKRFSKGNDKGWSDFENAATYNYTRTFVDRMYRDSSTLVIPTFSEIDELKIEVESLKRDNNQMHEVIDRIDVQGKRMVPAMNWIMTAMDRVKMPAREQRPPPLVTTSN